MFNLQCLLQFIALLLTLAAVFGMFYLIKHSGARDKAFCLTEAGLLVVLILLFAVETFQLLILHGFSRKQINLEQRILWDQTTGILSRIAFDQIAEEEIRRAGRYRHGLTVCLLSPDDFSSFVASFGQARADELLKRFAVFLQGQIRFVDCVARDHGDQFWILLPHTHLVGAEKFIARLLAEAEREMECTFSAGITSYRSGEIKAQFLMRTSVALAHANRKGRKSISCMIGDDENPTFIQF